MLLGFALVLMSGFVFGELFGKLRLPKLTGMIAAGIALGSLGLLDEKLLGISAELRKIALVIILLRAGMNLKLSDLKKIGRPAALLCFVPACFEMAGTVLLAPPLLGLSVTEAAVMGAVLAAVSPAVIVPKMLKLMEERRGTDKLIPQMILAGASIDDVFVIVMFSVFSGIEQGGELSALTLLNIPLSLVLGAAAGAALGLLLALLFGKIHLRDSAKVIVVLSCAFLLTAAEDALSGRVGFSGLVAVMAAGLFMGVKAQEQTQRVSAKLGKLWCGAEIVLFVLVGAAVDIGAAAEAGAKALLLIAGALVLRSAGVFLCLIRTKLSAKERLFCAFSYLPKATVQAAIGGVPLAMGMACGQQVLSVAVIAILVTATLGAALIEAFGKRWLLKEE
ncbi:MAG: cation:proton antiporter [Oscillospiraceae bacterium]